MSYFIGIKGILALLPSPDSICYEVFQVDSFCGKEQNTKKPLK